MKTERKSVTKMEWYLSLTEIFSFSLNWHDSQSSESEDEHQEAYIHSNLAKLMINTEFRLNAHWNNSKTIMIKKWLIAATKWKIKIVCDLIKEKYATYKKNRSMSLCLLWSLTLHFKTLISFTFACLWHWRHCCFPFCHRIAPLILSTFNRILGAVPSWFGLGFEGRGITVSQFSVTR